MLVVYRKPYRLEIPDRKEGLLVYVKSHLLSRPEKKF